MPPEGAALTIDVHTHVVLREFPRYLGTAVDVPWPSMVPAHACHRHVMDGVYFVCDDTCSHGQASLPEGTIEGDRIECPWHNGQFCIRTGAALTAPAVAPIAVYPVTLKEGMVFIPAKRNNP